MEPFAVHHVGTLAVIGLPARVSLSHAKALLGAGREALASGAAEIVLDLRTTDAVDSTALGVIVQIYREAAAQRRAVALLSPGTGIRRVLAITQLDRLFPVRSDLGAASQVAP